MLRNRSRRQAKILTLPRVSLTPLIDTALVLLVIFMVATPLAQNSVKVELPSGNVDEAGVQKQVHDLIVYIDHAGKLYLNGDHLTEKQLIQKIKQTVGATEGQTVIVKADQSINYGIVVELVDAIKFIGGIKYVALATQKAHTGKGSA